ncbi:MAG TPA: FtsX-like permease family protein, partial [Vicinamibacterales bacterium]
REFEDRSDRWFEMFAVRRRGVDVRTADAEVARIAANLAAAYPDTNAGRGARVVSDFDYRVEAGGVNAKALLGLVLLVVLITCVNVANLLLARGATRTREIAVRVALGAGRVRLLRQLMTESLVLGVLGSIAGFTFAMWLIRLMPALLGMPPGGRSFTVFQADARVLLFTLLVTLVTTCLFGIVPSWLAARADVAPLIKGGAGGDARVERRLRQALVVSQIAISVVLLCGAAVMTRSFMETRRADVGVTRKPLLSAWLTAQDFTNAAVREAVDRLAAAPGAVHAAVAIRAPLSLSGGARAMPVYFPEIPVAPGEGLPDVKVNAVSADYFATTGTRLIAGRMFTREDEIPGEPVMIVSQQFERRFFPGRSAIGARVRPGGATAPEHRIVGVVQDAVIEEIDEPLQPYFYLPFFRGSYGEVTFLVQTAGDAGAFTSTLKRTLKDVDPRLDPRRVITMQDYMAYSASRYRATAALAVALGTVGLLLTALGIYGVISYRTARRTREIGIRMALGARAQDVLGLVVREGAIVAVAGVAIGLATALVVTRSMSSMLFRVGAWDPVSFALAAILVFALACAATVVPARRATRVAPSEALRDTQ